MVYYTKTRINVCISMHSSTKTQGALGAACVSSEGFACLQTIPDGFGLRLREERERLGLSQTALGTAGGVKRLAQSQYESGSSAPSVRYLAAVALVGVDIKYTLFGRRRHGNSLSANEVSRIEGRAFELLEEFASAHPEATYGAEGRFAMFQVLRANLMEEALVNSVEGGAG
jgi:transcriptional regulator with XRE-family HTH domain